MGIDFKKLEEALDNMTDEEIEKFFPPDTIPKGWLSIEEYLPMWLAKDFQQGYSIYLVRNNRGEEFLSAVGDHNVWYYEAKEAGITHWFNE